jgi:hypothetical protein
VLKGGANQQRNLRTKVLTSAGADCPDYFAGYQFFAEPSNLTKMAFHEKGASSVTA